MIRSPLKKIAMHVLFIILILAISLSGEENEFSSTVASEKDNKEKPAASTNLKWQDKPTIDSQNRVHADTLKFQIKEPKTSKPVDITISTFEDIDIE